MRRVPQRRCPGASAWTLALALASAPAVAAPATGRLTLELGAGYEAQSSPLVRITPQDALIYLEGLQRMQGAHGSAAIDAGVTWALPDRMSLSVEGEASFKRAPRSPDLDFGSLSVRPGVQLALPSASAGLRVNLQHMDVAGRPFRATHGVQGDWTRFDGNGFWTFVADVGQYRHKGELSDLDASAGSLVLQRHQASPFRQVDSFDLALHVSRERNVRGFDELSHRAVMLSAVLHWHAASASWSLGRHRQRARFGASAGDADELRRLDRTGGIDLMAEWTLDAARSVRIEANAERNRSSARLYESRYRRLAVTLRCSY